MDGRWVHMKAEVHSDYGPEADRGLYDVLVARDVVLYSWQMR